MVLPNNDANLWGMGMIRHGLRTCVQFGKMGGDESWSCQIMMPNLRGIGMIIHGLAK